MVEKIKELWCSWTHGGGTIKRDALGNINWQCNKCSRWCEPVLVESNPNNKILDGLK
jgi:hypothetical protein